MVLTTRPATLNTRSTAPNNRSTAPAPMAGKYGETATENTRKHCAQRTDNNHRGTDHCRERPLAATSLRSRTTDGTQSHSPARSPVPWNPLTRGRRTKPEAASESETEWNRRETSRKPNQDTARGRCLSPAPRGLAGAPEHTAGSEHNGAVELGTPESGQGELDCGERDCADADRRRFVDALGNPHPFQGTYHCAPPPEGG